MIRNTDGKPGGSKRPRAGEPEPTIDPETKVARATIAKFQRIMSLDPHDRNHIHRRDRSRSVIYAADRTWTLKDQAELYFARVANEFVDVSSLSDASRHVFDVEAVRFDLLQAAGGLTIVRRARASGELSDLLDGLMYLIMSQEPIFEQLMRKATQISDEMERLEAGGPQLSRLGYPLLWYGNMLRGDWQGGETDRTIAEALKRTPPTYFQTETAAQTIMMAHDVNLGIIQAYLRLSDGAPATIDFLIQADRKMVDEDAQSHPNHPELNHRAVVGLREKLGGGGADISHIMRVLSIYAAPTPPAGPAARSDPSQAGDWDLVTGPPWVFPRVAQKSTLGAAVSVVLVAAWIGNPEWIMMDEDLRIEEPPEPVTRLTHQQIHQFVLFSSRNSTKTFIMAYNERWSPALTKMES